MTSRLVLLLLAVTVFLAVAEKKSEDSSCSSSSESGSNSGSNSGSSSSSSEEHHDHPKGHHHKHHHKKHHHHHGDGDNDGCGGDGWKKFTRPNGKWCIKVFPGTNLGMQDASSLCEGENAQLTGIQDPDEMTYIHESASSKLSVSTGSLWIGARRTDACIGSLLTATCNKLNSFYWTDSSTTGTAGFSWLDGSQPDNALGGNQNCISFFYAPSNTTVNGVNWYPGALDDVNCVNGVMGIPLREYRGYVCGKSAN